MFLPIAGEGQQSAFAHKASLAEAGIYFDDDYDYSQHLRTRGAANAEVVSVDKKAMKKHLKVGFLYLPGGVRGEDWLGSADGSSFP